MSRRNPVSWAAAAFAAALAASLGACDYVQPTDINPNAVADATLDQLFTGAQLNAFFMAEDQINRFSSIWMQQLAGTDRQFSIFDTYVVKESDVSGEFSSRYTGGGLIDLRRAGERTTAANRRAYAGVLKIYEAWDIGEAASIWGDIPYSQAADPSIAAPALDRQEDVYAAVQALLDAAIADLATAEGGPGSADMVFGGNLDRWTSVAHTIKARFYMHWVEAQKGGASAAANTACGGDCLTMALAESANGIHAPAGNWSAVHTTSQTESNVWYQFMNDRSGYISAGAYLVDLLASRGDPRLALYYSRNGAGDFVGSHPGENLGDASVLNLTRVGGATYRTPIVTCAENQLIAAEANYDLGNESAARAALDAGIECQQLLWQITVPHPASASLSGAALLREIMTQKYIAGFLGEETWNDYKRTCLPALATYNGKAIPGRLIYGEAERQTNPNLPAPADQPLRNTNDPQPCTAG